MKIISFIEDEEVTRLPGLFIRLRRRPRLRTETRSGGQVEKPQISNRISEIKLFGILFKL